MLSIAVCDDEVLECCNLSKKIRRILTELHVPFIVRQFTSGQELLKCSEKFDILFLDIIMDDLDGIKIGKMCQERDFANILVFVSSSRKYVFDAYDVEAYHYLVKPIEDEKLRMVLQRALKKINTHSQGFLVVNQERTKKKLFLEDVYYFEVRGRIIYAHGADGITATFYEQISILENTLREKGFSRCHKSYLINIKYMDAYNRQSVVLENGEHIMIAKRRYPAFCDDILFYMRKNGGIT